jgi:hypothetical protein
MAQLSIEEIVQETLIDLENNLKISLELSEKEAIERINQCLDTAFSKAELDDHNKLWKKLTARLHPDKLNGEKELYTALKKHQVTPQRLSLQIDTFKPLYVFKSITAPLSQDRNKIEEIFDRALQVIFFAPLGLIFTALIELYRYLYIALTVAITATAVALEFVPLLILNSSLFLADAINASVNKIKFLFTKPVKSPQFFIDNDENVSNSNSYSHVPSGKPSAKSRSFSAEKEQGSFISIFHQNAPVTNVPTYDTTIAINNID